MYVRVMREGGRRRRRLCTLVSFGVVSATALSIAGPPSAMSAEELGPVRRVSVSGSGDEGDGASLAPALSADGRYVAFWSFASNLVPGDTNGVADVFVRDRRTGATSRASVNSRGVEANAGVQAGSGNPGRVAISADGRFVAFTSAASNLVAADTNDAADVFVRDLRKGTTRRMSVNSGEVQGNAGSGQPAISADGRYVVFSSTSSNLVRKDRNSSQDVFVRDRRERTTRRVSLNSDGVQANDASRQPAVSATGRYVAFVSLASNLAAKDQNQLADVFVRDRWSRTTRRVSPITGGRRWGEVDGVAISAGGRFVAFNTDAGLARGDGDGDWDVYVRDLRTGGIRIASLAQDGLQMFGRVGWTPAMSAGGRYIAFSLRWPNTEDDWGPPGTTYVYVRDLVNRTTRAVSTTSDRDGLDGDSGAQAVSADGRFVAFQSEATNLVAGDGNAVADVFIRRLSR